MTRARVMVTMIWEIWRTGTINHMIMKKTLRYFAIVAAAATTLIACNREMAEVVPTFSEGITLNFASERPSLLDEGGTKTVYNNGTIEWSTGDKIKVAITVDGAWMAADGAPAEGKTPKFYASDGLQQGASTFTVSNLFTLEDAGTYKFYGLYPSSASSSNDIGNAPSVSVTIPANQTPAANSFDNAADLMIAVSPEYDGIPSDRTIDLNWTRLVAHGDITLKNLPTFASGENVRSIEFSIQDGGDLVGQHYVDLTTGAVSLPNNPTTKNAVTVKADNLSVSNNQLEFWFSALPFTATSIKIVLTTNEKIYTKEYTNISKTFVVNKRNTLGISMSNATVEDNEQVIEDGDYVIAYVGAEESFMMLSDDLIVNGDPTSTARSYAALPEVSSDGKIHTSANAVWTIVYDSNSAEYTIQSLETGAFLKGSGADVYLELNTTGNSFKGEYYDQTHSTVKFTVTTGSDTRGIGFNTKQKRFAMYKGSAQQPISLTLYPAETTPAPLKCATPTFSPEAGAVNEGTTVTISTSTADATIHYTTDGSTPTTSSPSGNTVVVNSAMTIKAIAVKDDYENSNVAEATYTIKPGIQIVTIAEFLNESVNQTDWYQLTGVIKNIANTSYGNFTIEDATGSVYVYGLTATQQDQNDQSFATLGLQVGYTVTIITLRSEHNGSAQAGGNIPAYYVSHIAPPSLVVSPSSLVFDTAGESKTVEATADNFDGSVSITASSDNPHFTTSVSGATITVTAAANQGGSSLSGTITVTATDGTATKTATVSVSQNAGVQPAHDQDVLWQEDFTGYGTTMPASATGEHVYGGGTVTYTLTNGGANTALNAGDQYAGGSVPELLIGKSNGAFTISGIPTGGATTMTLTFKSNHGDYCTVTSSSSGITVGTPNVVLGNVITTITATSGVTSFNLSITNIDSSNTRADDFVLIVGVPPVTLASISVSGQNDTFTQGDAFEFGGTVMATYSNGTTANVTSSASFSGYNMSTTGSQTVTVSYTEGGVTKTTSYSINVNAPSSGPKTYQYTITTSDFTASGYDKPINSITATATDGSGNTLTVNHATKNAGLQNGKIQFKKKTGMLYNTTNLGTVVSVTLTGASGGTGTVYKGSTENPTSSGSGGFFTIKETANGTLTCTSITVTFTK